MKIESVLIVGCGGLGGFVSEELCRLNLKKITLIDGDTFSIENMNRQLFCSSTTLGKNKAQVVKTGIQDKCNSDIVAIPSFLDDSNINILADVDLVIDCCDNIKTRLLLESSCLQYNKILIHGGIEGLVGQVCICYPGDNTLSRLYKNNPGKKVLTYSYSVATIASFEVALVHKLMTEENLPYKNKMIFIDMDSLSTSIVNV